VGRGCFCIIFYTFPLARRYIKNHKTNHQKLSHDSENNTFLTSQGRKESVGSKKTSFLKQPQSRTWWCMLVIPVHKEAEAREF
jgi:hypothetical protein